MGQWLYNNAPVISAVANIAMVVIWLSYLQLFYRRFRQQRLPQMMIHETARQSLDGDCLLINMSQEIVTVTAVMAIAYGPGGENLVEVTNYKRRSTDDSSLKQIEQYIRQGPMNPGMFLVLGSMRDLIDRAAGQQNRDTIRCLEIRAVFVHSAYTHPVGVLRQHELRRDLLTRQYRSRGDRRRVRNWLASLD